MTNTSDWEMQKHMTQKSHEDSRLITVNVGTIITAFSEWDRRYREDPKAFESDFERLLRGQTPETYGEEVTPYFLELLEAASPQTPDS